MKSSSLLLKLLVLALVALVTLQGAASIDLSVAEDNWVYCLASYCPSYLQSWNCQWCNNNTVVSNQQVDYIIQDDETNTFGYAAHNDYAQTVSLVFRGTVPTSLENWITDLSFAKTTGYGNVPGAEVHKGFFEAYLGVSDQVANAVNDLVNQYSSYQFVITGHSLGGALATLAALNLSQSYSNIIVYTFGSPRVGNQAFANYYDQQLPQTYRLTNYDDIVPHLPPEALNFFHVTTEYWNNGYEWVQCSSTNGEDPYCADSVNPIDYSVSDHLDYFGIPLGFPVPTCN